MEGGEGAGRAFELPKSTNLAVSTRPRAPAESAAALMSTLLGFTSRCATPARAAQGRGSEIRRSGRMQDVCKPSLLRAEKPSLLRAEKPSLLRAEKPSLSWAGYGPHRTHGSAGAPPPDRSRGRRSAPRPSPPAAAASPPRPTPAARGFWIFDFLNFGVLHHRWSTGSGFGVKGALAQRVDTQVYAQGERRWVAQADLVESHPAVLGRQVLHNLFALHPAFSPRIAHPAPRASDAQRRRAGGLTSPTIFIGRALPPTPHASRSAPGAGGEPGGDATRRAAPGCGAVSGGERSAATGGVAGSGASGGTSAPLSASPPSSSESSLSSRT